MKIGIRIALIVVVCVLGYLTVKSIVDPINFQKKVEAEEELIKERLTKIKDAQLAYKEVHGSFSDNWDSLIKTAKTGSFMVLSMSGDPEDSTSVVQIDTMLVGIKDSLYANFNLDSLKFVPNSETNEIFDLAAGTTVQNNVNVPVFEVKDPSPLSKKRIREKNPLTVGSMTEARYNGNW